MLTAFSVLLLPAAAAAGTHPAPARTTVRHVRPTGQGNHLKPGYRVDRRTAGRCWTTSAVQDDAYRCMAGNSILDPCWRLGPGRRRAVCLVVPWRHRVEVIRLRSRPASLGVPSHRLWGLRLANGARCAAAQGATGIYRGSPVEFYCTRGFSVVGEPDRSAATWRAHVIERVQGHWCDRGRLAVVTAWYARPTPG